MAKIDEKQVSRAIVQRYGEKLAASLENDVVIVGAGPSGMLAAHYLCEAGKRVTILEKRLAPGGGVWGGGMAMNEAVVQDEVLPILDEVGCRHRPWEGNLHTVDSTELAAVLCVKAVQSGAILLNVTFAEDVCVHDGRVDGVVANRTNIGGMMPVDPIMMYGKAVIDATGHDAVVVAALRKRGLLRDEDLRGGRGEGVMDVDAGENFVVENVCEVFPGLWLSGMSVCSALGGPRMGPIFGGMLLSGKNVAEKVLAAID